MLDCLTIELILVICVFCLPVSIIVVIFLIQLYQRWIYRVDKTRANEFGYKEAEKEEEEKEEKEDKKTK